jgi:hypothetical protein
MYTSKVSLPPWAAGSEFIQFVVLEVAAERGLGARGIGLE